MIKVQTSQGVTNFLYEQVFKQSPHNMLLIGIDAPTFTMLDMTDGFLATLKMTRDQIVGKSLLSVFPNQPDIQESDRLIRSLYKVMATKEPDIQGKVRYDLPIEGTGKLEERHWSTTNTPFFDEQGNIAVVCHSALELTMFFTRKH